MKSGQKPLTFVSVTLYVSLAIPALTILIFLLVDKLSPSGDPGRDFALGIFLGLLLLPAIIVGILSAIISFIISFIFVKMNGFSSLKTINKISFYISATLLILLIMGGSAAFISYINTPQY